MRCLALAASAALASLAAAAKATEGATRAFADMPFIGRASNKGHGWGGKRRKLKPSANGQQPRRSKAQRRARAA